MSQHFERTEDSKVRDDIEYTSSDGWSIGVKAVTASDQEVPYLFARLAHPDLEHGIGKVEHEEAPDHDVDCNVQSHVFFPAGDKYTKILKKD